MSVLHSSVLTCQFLSIFYIILDSSVEGSFHRKLSFSNPAPYSHTNITSHTASLISPVHPTHSHQSNNTMSSKTKRMSADEKRQTILKIYHGNKEVYTEKEIVALASKAGVNVNT